MRLFAGLRPSRETLRDLEVFVSELPLTRPSRPATWHVTLAFIGDVEVHQRVDATAALTEAVRGIAPFELRLSGGGAFSGTSILFTGVDGDMMSLSELAGNVRASLDRFGVPFDAKPLHAHLTVARPGRRASRERFQLGLDALSDYQGPYWTVTDVVLYRSHLGPPVDYEAVEHFPLG